MRSINIDKLTKDNIFINKEEIEKFISLKVKVVKEQINALYLNNGIIYDVNIRKSIEQNKVFVRFYIFLEKKSKNEKVLHRLDGPALYIYEIDNDYKFGEYYYQFDQLHNDDGPAIISSSGYKSYYINSECLSRFKYMMKFSYNKYESDIEKLITTSAKKYIEFSNEYTRLHSLLSNEISKETKSKYEELKKYCDEIDHYLLNTIYEQQVIIYNHFLENKDLEVKYLNQFDRYYTDVLLELLRKTNSNIESKKDLIKMKISRKESFIEHQLNEKKKILYNLDNHRRLNNKLNIENREGYVNILKSKISEIDKEIDISNGEVKYLKSTLVNVNSKYVDDELEELLMDYIDKIDEFNIQIKDVNIDLEKELLKEVINTKMLKI